MASNSFVALFLDKINGLHREIEIAVIAQCRLIRPIDKERMRRPTQLASRQRRFIRFDEAKPRRITAMIRRSDAGHQ